MPKASEHLQSILTKLLYIGDSGTGKTTSLFQLLDTYQLRVYDFDNLLAPLIAMIKRECPQYLDRLEFMSFRDSFKSSPNGPICSNPTAYINFLKALDEWEDGSSPREWGSDIVCVVDSWTTACRSAYFWARALQGGGSFAEGVPLKGFSPQATYHTAQQSVMNVVADLTSEGFNANLIVVAHIKYIERDGVTKGYPVAVGTAISPEIPTYFPSVALASRAGGKRIIRTASTAMIDLKDPHSFDLQEELPMESGLATIFAKARGQDG